MQITLNQTEVENAVREYITNQGLTFGSGTPEVTLVAGRAPTGITASIEFSNVVVAPQVPADLPELPNKPEVDLAAFKPDSPVAPTPKAKPAVKKPTTPKAAPTPKEVVEPVKETTPPSALFDEALEEEEPVVEEDVTTDTLFAI